MHLFSLFNVDRDSFQKTVKGGNGGVLKGVFSVSETFFVVRNIVVAAIFDFMTVEDWGE